MTLVVVGCSGGMKGVFVQGVFNALESARVRADAYAGASASALPAVSAATYLCGFVGVHYWQRVRELLDAPGNDLSHVMRQVSREWDGPGEPFNERLFQSPGSARLFIPANFVKSRAAAAITQGGASRRLGRRLLLAASRHEREWVDDNLELHLFDTHAPPGAPRLTPANLADVAYASSRMLHWAVPAWVHGQPYVDASYTCACPLDEMIAHGYDEIVIISTETGPLYRDIFADTILPEAVDGVSIHVIRPDMDLKTIGVDFASCTAEGLLEAFAHGEAKGCTFLDGWKGPGS